MSKPSPIFAKPPARWGVVSMVREPTALVVAFACYHLDLGAERVHLFFDDPTDPAAKIAARIRGVEVTLCDGTHWARMGYGKPPEARTKRQTLNANMVKAESDLDWLLHIDADEFLWLPDGIEAELSAVPETARWIHFPNLERCWDGPIEGHILGGLFRVSLAGLPDLTEQVYGQRAKALQGGFGGHSSGKGMARGTDRESFIAIHRVRAKEGGEDLPKYEARAARILHFDGLTPQHWALKNLRFAAEGASIAKQLTRQRIATIGATLRAQNPERATVRMYEALYRLDARQVALLEEAGKLLRPDIDIFGAVNRHAPGLGLDFSMEAFNRPIARELSARSQAIVRQKRRAKKMLPN